MESEYERIVDFIDSIAESGRYIVVEGTNDKKALIAAGIKKDKIFTLNKPLYEIAEKIAKKTKQCIILTDLDKQGKKLCSALVNNLSIVGVKPDRKFREFILKETKLRQIEGFTHYLDNLR